MAFACSWTSRPKSNRRINKTITNACRGGSGAESFSYPCDSHIDLFRPQRNSNEAAGEVSLLLFQQVFALVQSDVEQSCPLAAGVSGWFELQGDLELPHREVVAEIVGDGGDGAERVSGNRAVKLGHPGGIQLPAHQLQVTQVPETVRCVTQGQAGFAAGCGGGSPMVVGGHSLQEKAVKDQPCFHQEVTRKKKKKATAANTFCLTSEKDVPYFSCRYR